MRKVKAKKSARKAKKVVVSLSQRDYAKLVAYAEKHNTTRPLAAKRLLRAQLATFSAEKTNIQPENQLGLFDSLQIDIFNGTSKTID